MPAARVLAPCALLFLAAAQGASQEIADIAIRVVDSDRAKIAARVEFTPNNRLVEMVRNEQVLKLTFQVRVILERPYWVDLEYKTLDWDAQFAYDNVLNAYQVITFNGEERVARDVRQAFEIIGDIHGLEMIAQGLGDTLKMSRAQIHARFEVNVEELPPAIRIELLSLLDWDFSTGWRVWGSKSLLRDSL